MQNSDMHYVQHVPTISHIYSSFQNLEAIQSSVTNPCEMIDKIDHIVSAWKSSSTEYQKKKQIYSIINAVFTSFTRMYEIKTKEKLDYLKAVLLDCPYLPLSTIMHCNKALDDSLRERSKKVTNVVVDERNSLLPKEEIDAIITSSTWDPNYKEETVEKCHTVSDWIVSEKKIQIEQLENILLSNGVYVPFLPNIASSPHSNRIHSIYFEVIRFQKVSVFEGDFLHALDSISTECQKSGLSENEIESLQHAMGELKTEVLTASYGLKVNEHSFNHHPGFDKDFEKLALAVFAKLNKVNNLLYKSIDRELIRKWVFLIGIHGL